VSLIFLSTAQQAAAAKPAKLVAFENWAKARSATEGLSSGMVPYGGVTFRVNSHDPGAGGSMVGTSWGSWFSAGEAAFNRVAQHAFPSEAVYLAAAGTPLIMNTAALSTTYAFTSLTRNGYTSIGRGSTASSLVRVSAFYYWDALLGEAMQVDASNAATPTVFTPT
jgi:hypothetical protein